MRKITLLATLFFGLIVGTAQAQQLDVAFGASGVTSPNSVSSLSFSPQLVGGGAFLGFSGDVLLKHQLGVQGEVNWRAKQNLWGGYQPFRPILYDVNGIWAPRFGNRAGAELMGGIGGESVVKSAAPRAEIELFFREADSHPQVCELRKHGP